jgi:hypothetical protein
MNCPSRTNKVISTPEKNVGENVSSLQDSVPLLGAYPGLTSWANICRRSAAGFSFGIGGLPLAYAENFRPRRPLCRISLSPRLRIRRCK